MQAQINRIADILWKDDEISGSMHYTEQISWILFLKFLDDYERLQDLEAKLSGNTYKSLLDEHHKRDIRAAPTKDGKIDVMKALMSNPNNALGKWLLRDVL